MKTNTRRITVITSEETKEPKKRSEFSLENVPEVPRVGDVGFVPASIDPHPDRKSRGLQGHFALALALIGKAWSSGKEGLRLFRVRVIFRMVIKKKYTA